MMQFFNNVKKKLQNIVQTMHLTMSIAHPYLHLHTLLKTHRALPVLTTEGEITKGVGVSNEVHLHKIPMSKEIDLFGNKKIIAERFCTLPLQG